MAGRSACAFHVPRGSRPGRDLRPRLVTRARSSSAPEDSGARLPSEGDRLMAGHRGHRVSAHERVRVGVVGLGYWGPNLVRNFSESPLFDVAWACDVRTESLDAVSTRYPAISRTTDFEEVLRDAGVDAVAVATPVSTHHQLALAALEAGKHVFVEKPLAASAEAASELIEVATRAGLVLMPGHTFIYSPPVLLIRDLI